MRISSLTSHVSTDTLNTNSVFLYAGGAKAGISVLGSKLPLYVPDAYMDGAMWSRSTSDSHNTSWTVSKGPTNLEYNIGSFADTNTPSVFQVPTSDYRFVEVTWTAMCYGANPGGNLYAAIVDPAQPNPQLQTRQVPVWSGLVNATADRLGFTFGYVYECSSGDKFGVSVYVAGTTLYFNPTTIDCFTIRGIR